jgi:hypothetical protein
VRSRSVVPPQIPQLVVLEGELQASAAHRTALARGEGPRPPAFDDMLAKKRSVDFFLHAPSAIYG